MRRRRRAWERTAGLVAAALLHLALFAGIFATQTSATTGDMIDNGQPGVAVTLIRMRSLSAQATSAPSEQERLEKLRVQLVGDLPTEPADHKPRHANDPDKIIQSFDNNDFFFASSAGRGPTAPSETRGVPQVQEDPFARASVPMPGMASALERDLWAQLARCWKPPHAFPAVILSVTLDDRGALAEPPAVVRETAQSPDRTRLAAEGEAVRAVVACAPFTIRTSGQRSFRLEFARPGGASG